MSRKILRNVEKRGVHATGNAPSVDRKCWQRTERLSGKLFVGWVQPTNSPEKAVGCTHPTIVKQAFPDSL